MTKQHLYRIHSKQNDHVKRWRKLQTRKGRRLNQAQLIEGEHLLSEAVKSGYHFRSLIVTERRVAWLEQFGNQYGLSAPLYIISPSIFNSLVDTDTPQEVAAEVVIPSDIESTPCDGHTFLLLDGIQDPGNLGAIIRTAEATKVDGIWLGEGCADPTNPKVVRSSMGSIFRMSIQSCQLKQKIDELQSQGIQVISTSPSANQNHFDLQYPEKVAFLLGNEGKGVQPALDNQVDYQVFIPMSGMTESLNVSISTAVLLYERIRQQSFSCKSEKHSL